MTEQPCANLSDLVVKIMASFWEFLSKFKITEAYSQRKISFKETIRSQV